MITVGAAFPYLVQSLMILALCFLWVAALLDVQSHMRKGVTSHKVLVFIAISISVLAVFLIVATDEPCLWITEASLLARGVIGGLGLEVKATRVL